VPLLLPLEPNGCCHRTLFPIPKIFTHGCALFILLNHGHYFFMPSNPSPNISSMMSEPSQGAPSASVSPDEMRTKRSRAPTLECNMSSLADETQWDLDMLHRSMQTQQLACAPRRGTHHHRYMDLLWWPTP
jgi:hypothetical protein